MGRSKRNSIPNINPNPRKSTKPTPTSLLDKMIDGREYQSIIGLNNVAVDLGEELKKAIEDISAVRKRPVICYIANTLNSTVAAACPLHIDNSDDAPFIEMTKSIPYDKKEVDIILVTPGGSADIVDYMVKKLRSRFDDIAFILPYMAMSAGTIFCLSGDDLIMSESAFIGPIDPQVPSKTGMYMPAQAVTTLLSDIKRRGDEQIKKGLKPDWTDIEILRNLDAKELGNTITASTLSTRLVTDYLRDYKFRTWIKHKNGEVVTPEERNARANEIATLLCNNSFWLSHGSRITREIAVEKCKLKVTYPESIPGLDRAIRRFWALMRLTLEHNMIVKIYTTGDYSLFRQINIQPKTPNR